MESEIVQDLRSKLRIAAEALRKSKERCLGRDLMDGCHLFVCLTQMLMNNSWTALLIGKMNE